MTNHHANLLVGAPLEAESFIEHHLRAQGIEAKNNADFLVIRPETFGIDEARELKKLASRKALGRGKFFLILPEKITLEAQNALLKLFEDPTPSTSFYLAIRDKNLIVPTLLSRMNVVALANVTDTSQAKDFYLSSLRKRLLFAQRFAEEKADVALFLDDMIFFAKKEKHTEVIKKIYDIRRLLTDQNMGARIIIEHLALVI